MAQVGDTVMVLMSHPERYVIAWDGKEYVLERDKEKFIPFELAANYFGDPRAMGAIVATQDHKRRFGWIPDRPTEVRRLRVLYGVQHGDEACVFLPEGLLERIPDTGDWPARKAHWAAIDRNIPIVQMYDLETRERLYHVLEDPLGEHVTPANITMSNEQRLQSRVDRLEELLASLTQNQRPAEGLVTPEGVIPGNPDAPPRPQSPAEQAMRQQGNQGEEPDWLSPDEKEHDLITSDRSGAAGLPPDRS